MTSQIESWMFGSRDSSSWRVMCQVSKMRRPMTRVERDAVHDEPVEALDDGVAALQAEEDDVAAAADGRRWRC